jgi:WD40 repeat protein
MKFLPRSADFQSAVSAIPIRQSVGPFRRALGCSRQRVGNPRYSRLETCATSAGRFPSRIYARLTAAFLAGLLFFCFSGSAVADETSESPVSFHKDIVPILKQSCTACHHPAKAKGRLDVTTHGALLKGGKSGPAFVPGDPAKSVIVTEISGDNPSMPEEGEPLSKAEIALIERWIREGANDDTPAEAANPFTLSEPPVYSVPPLISALAYSLDGKLLAVSGYHEVLLHSADGSNLVARLVGGSPKIESIAFSPDGKWLGVAGSAPSVFGEIQIWDLASNTLAGSWKVSTDSVYGLSWSPDSRRVAVGAADKTVRVIAASDGKELLRFDNHSDWVFSTTFTVDGKRLLSGSRDKAMKLIDLSNAQFIDDINKLLERIVCIIRHPKEDTVLYGGEMGAVRIYRISENQGRTAANNDVNLLREFERQPGPVHAVAYNPDGSAIAVGGAGSEVRVYRTDGKRVASLKGHSGAIFSIAYHPDGGQLAAGGFDGSVRIYDPSNGNLLHQFVPVPIQEGDRVARQSLP